MKKFIITIFAVLLGITASTQVVKEGNTFTQTKTEKVTAAKKTQFTYQDSKGNKYPIYISSRGSLYVIKVSKKTNKEYKCYLPKETQEEIKKYLQFFSFKGHFLKECVL